MVTLVWLGIVLTFLVLNPKNTWSAIKGSGPLYRKLRWRHFGYGAVSIVGTAVIAATLYLYVPVLRWGWIPVLLEVLGGFGGDSGGSPDVEISVMDRVTFLLPVYLIVALLVLVLPVFARNEEEAFRAPLYRQSRCRVARGTLVFGLIHLIMGIPLAAALALSFAGWIFYLVFSKYADESSKDLPEDIAEKYPDVSAEYAKYRGTQESTLAHLAHNLYAILLVVAVMTFYVLGA